MKKNLRIINFSVLLIIIVQLLISCANQKEEKTFVYKNKKKNDSSTTIIINNPFEKKLRLEYKNSKGLQYSFSSTKIDTININLNSRSFLNVKDIGLKKGKPFLMYNINMFTKDTLKIDHSLKKTSYTFLNTNRKKYDVLIRDLKTSRKQKKIDSIRMYLSINRRDSTIVNKTSIISFFKEKQSLLSTQIKIIDSLYLVNNKQEIDVNTIKDELKYRYYSIYSLDLNLFKKQYILDSLFANKYINEKVLLNSTYKFDYLKSFVTLLSIQIKNEDLQYDNTNVYDLLDKYFENENLKIARQFSLLNMNREIDKNLRIKYYNRYFETYKDLDFDSFFKYYVNSLKSEGDYIEVLAAPKQFDLNLKTLKTKTTLDKVIKNNKGKVLLIDFWASWCAPCRISFPAAKDLIKEFSNKDFTYIYVSIDKIPSKWFSAVKEEKLTSYIHSYITSGGENTFLKDVKLEYIPRYIIVDKQGKIVELYSPSPETKKVRELIKKYLNK